MGGFHEPKLMGVLSLWRQGLMGCGTKILERKKKEEEVRKTAKINSHHF